MQVTQGKARAVGSENARIIAHERGVLLLLCAGKCTCDKLSAGQWAPANLCTASRVYVLSALLLHEYGMGCCLVVGHSNML
jgi:hypothetical protein